MRVRNTLSSSMRRTVFIPNRVTLTGPALDHKADAGEGAWLRLAGGRGTAGNISLQVVGCPT